MSKIHNVVLVGVSSIPSPHLSRHFEPFIAICPHLASLPHQSYHSLTLPFWAGGAIGPSILTALTESPFNVTVFTRADSKTTLPSAVKSVTVDYNSVTALTSALKGQDALISTLGGLAPHIQTNVIKATLAAGIKRIIPSEFGSDTTNAKVRSLPVYADKVAAQELLAAEAAKGNVTYNLIFNGPLLDWGLIVGFLVDA